MPPGLQGWQGWVLHEPGGVGEHLVYDAADFEVMDLAPARECAGAVRHRRIESTVVRNRGHRTEGLFEVGRDAQRRRQLLLLRKRGALHENGDDGDVAQAVLMPFTSSRKRYWFARSWRGKMGASTRRMRRSASVR